MKKSLIGLIIIIALVGAAFYGQAKLGLFKRPCSQPIAYSLGSFDERFDLPQAAFLSALEKAVKIWEEPSGVDLFEYNVEGKLKVNLIYDYRQEATDKLKSLGLRIDDTQSSYDSLKIRYDQMNADHTQLKQSLDQQVADFNSKKEAYEAQVKHWNEQGGAPKNVANQLNAQRDALQKQAEKISKDEQALNGLAENINAMVDVLNRMAVNLNLNVADYNDIGASRGDEFEEGAYIETGREKKIEIYEFDSEDRLVRVLAHELGHALGLEHIGSNADAIMYRLNQSRANKAASEDLAALNQLCEVTQ